MVIRYVDDTSEALTGRPADIKQIIAGFGLGLTLQSPNIAVQTVLPDDEVSIGLSLLQFVGLFGGTIFVTVSQTMLENKLVKGLAGVLPDLDPSSLGGQGATTLRSMASGEQLEIVLEVYNDSIRSVWYLALGLSVLTFVASWGLEWKSVKKEKKQAEKKDKVGNVVDV